MRFLAAAEVFMRQCLLVVNRQHGKVGSGPAGPFYSNAQMSAPENVVGPPARSSVTRQGSLGDEGGLHRTPGTSLSTRSMYLSLPLSQN